MVPVRGRSQPDSAAVEPADPPPHRLQDVQAPPATQILMLASISKCLALIDRQQRGRWLLVLVVAVFASLVEALGAVIIFILLRLVNDPGNLEIPLFGDLHESFPDTSEETLIGGLAIVIGGFFLIRALLLTGQTWLQNRTAHREGALLSRRLLAGYLRMPYEFHLSRNSAESIRNAYQSVDAIIVYGLLPVVMLISESLVVVAMLVVLLIAAPVPTLMALSALAVLVAGILRLVQPRIERCGMETQRFHEINLKAIQESLSGIREIKVLGREPYFEGHFAQNRMALARAQYIRGALTDIPRIGIETVLMLILVGFLGITVATSSSVENSLSILGLFGYATLRVMPGLNRILAQLNNLKYGGAAADAVTDDLRLIEESAAALDFGGEPLPFRTRLELECVSFRYPGSDRDALSEIDLAIARGESIGIVGPTGSGKTTLIDLLLGLLPPTLGRVSCDGLDVGQNLPAWQRNVGVVPQVVFLLDDTLRRNIAFGVADAEIDEEAVDEAVRLAQIEDFVGDLPEGLDTLVGERGVRISGGQRQRVSIARALYQRPSVVIFDEGTSALDSVTEAELIQALEPLRRERTIIMVAHRLSTVRTCDRVVLVRDGRIADIGRYEDLAERNVALMQGAG